MKLQLVSGDLMEKTYTLTITNEDGTKVSIAFESYARPEVALSPLDEYSSFVDEEDPYYNSYYESY